MYLYLFWLFPALIFLLFFMSDRRRLFNAYLFSINLGLLLLISAFLLVVRTELWFNQQIAIIVFVVISILVFLSIIFSSIFLLFNGRQMMLFEGKRLANLLSLLYGLFIIGALALHFLPYFPGNAILIYLTDFALFYMTFLYLSYVSYCILWDFLQSLSSSQRARCHYHSWLRFDWRQGSPTLGPAS